ncbi:hypothetical protein SNE40_014727 [Patella caerulea]|uniref:receptor protein-tyrosine kinase n=1 Tax=Patella caerulea TaxID=87958 RepID=A0AAN8PQZ8_PATCE
MRATTHLLHLVFWYLITICAASRINDYLRSVTIGNTTLIKTITVDNRTGDVYFAGSKVIGQLDKDLRLKNQIYFNNPKGDDDISLLLVHAKSKKLLSCGTHKHGLCNWHSLQNISIYTTLDSENPTNYLGSNETTIVLPSSVKGCRRCLLVMQPVNGYQNETNDFISTRRVRSKRHQYSIPLAFNITHQDFGHMFSGLNVDPLIKKPVYMKPIYGFNDGRQFSYFLLLQENPDTTQIETKLARICSNDKLYNSYVEIELRCSHRLFGVYKKATSAYTSDGHLYISWVQGNRTSEDLDEGSIVCDFSVAELNTFFTETFVNCFKYATGYQPFWLSSKPKKCKLNSRSGSLDCGRRTQHGLSGTRYLNKAAFYHLESMIRALVSVRQSGQPVIILATSTGHIKKVLVSGSRDRKQEYFSMKVTEGNIGLQETVYLHNETLLYTVANNKIIEFNIKSCSMYKTCSACLSVRDPNGCGWYNGQCLRSDECKQLCGKLSNKSCPPSIKSIHPTDGPTCGGTLVTINGDYFDWDDNSKKVDIDINVADVVCTLKQWDAKKLVCKTRRAPKPILGAVQVTVNKRSDGIRRPYILQGSTKSTQIFQFKEVSVDSYEPSYGPVSGGTIITLRGKHLNIGISRSIMIGRHECLILQFSYDMLQCKTSAISTGSEVGSYEETAAETFLRFYIDNGTVRSDPRYQFEYLPDPIITGISPKTTFSSGGVPLTVFGTNLNSVADPMLIYHNISKKYQPCRVKPGGLSMVCTVPALPATTDSDELKLHFLLDGTNEHTCKIITYLSDPVIFPFQGGSRTLMLENTQSVDLEFLGANLSSRFNVEDVDIIIGDRPMVCRVISLTNTMMICTLYNTSIFNDTKHPVKVVIGNLEFYPGTVQFMGMALQIIGLWWLICVPAFLIIIIIIAIMFIRNWRSQNRNIQNGFISQKTIVYRIPDIRITDVDDDMSQSLNSLDDIDTKSFDRLTSSTLSIFQKDNLIIQQQHIIIQEEIGKGNFGCVYKGTYLNPESDAGAESIEVAIKTLKHKTPDEKELNTFLEEALIMKDFSHENVLKLMGVCLADQAIPYVVLPFMKNGDLLSYIRNPGNNPTIKDLILFGVDVAKGMDYLAKSKFVHRDLAARNCMLDATLRVKVADFGLTRDVYAQEYYSCRDNKARLPIKWMAVESIQKGTFTSMSDVWSYGVLLWELMTRGVNPYSDVDMWDMQRYLLSGRRLARPEYCPIEMYVIMEKCWQADPGSRPSFSSLVTNIPIMLKTLETEEEGFKNTYINLDDSCKYIYPDIHKI